MSIGKALISGLSLRTTGGDRHAMTVLVVEPDPNTARELAGTLSAIGSVTWVPSAAAALAAISRNVPTLVITELDLPDMSGTQFIAHLHQVPSWRHVLVMAYTWRNSVQDKIAAFQAGADDVLVKRVDASTLIRHVHLVARFRQVLTGGA